MNRFQHDMFSGDEERENGLVEESREVLLINVYKRR